MAVPAIAIVDSGIDADRSDFGGRVVHQETLTTLTPNSPGDGRGHGTFVASVAAGEAAGYSGVAPGANIVSIDVLDDAGRATTSDVIAAADWIYRNKSTYGIRVANFSLHGTTPTSFRFDPLNKAVQKLWFSGVVVVASAGNYAIDGQESGVPFPPGNDPFVITAGATDTLGTVATDDDVVAPWSAWGHTADGFAKPDLAAPGRYIVGAVPPNSTLALERPDHMVAPGYMQLSGTSFAAPMISGAAAYLAGVHPDWRPDQIKGALMREAVHLPRVTTTAAGIGELAVGAAAALDTAPNANAALNQFLVEDPAGGPEPVFDEVTWATTAATDPHWSDGFWGDGFWGDGFWGDGFWGDNYWDPPTTPPDAGAPGGTATSALNHAIDDWLPSGGYWLTPP
jgi:serine protease AprX